MSKRLLRSLFFATEVVDDVADDMYNDNDHSHWQRTILGHTVRECSFAVLELNPISAGAKMSRILCLDSSRQKVNEAQPRPSVVDTSKTNEDYCFRIISKFPKLAKPKNKLELFGILSH